MVTGEITVRTCYGDADIPVEIYAKGPRPGTVWVRALNNLAPFTKMSHGGPYQDDTAVWSYPARTQRASRGRGRAAAGNRSYAG